MSTQYRFRNFRLDPAARELWMDDQRVALPASALDGLVYLVEHRDRAVGRDELIAAIWGRGDVADALLAQTVLRIRRVLGDTGSEQHAIRTVSRFGYRWVADTHIEDASPLLATTTADEAARVGKPAPRRRAMWIGVTAVSIALLVAVVAWHVRLRSAPIAAITERSAAVVFPAQAPPLEEWSWLRLGLMDLVASRLRLGGVTTAPTESVLALLKQSGTNEPDFAGALKVRPTARFHDGTWTITLSADGGAQLSVAADAPDVLAATRIAADQLLIALGRSPAPSDGAASMVLQELLQRTKAAVLADQFDLARELIAKAPAPLQETPEITLRLSQIEIGQGHYDVARQQLARLLDRVPRDIDPVLKARILNTLGGAEVRSGSLDDAQTSYDEAVDLLLPIRDAIGLGLAYSGRGAIAAQRGDLDAAAAELGRARVELDAAGDAFSVAQVDMNLGLIAGQRYRPAEALPILREAEVRFAKLGAREELAYVRYALIGIALQLLDTDAASIASDASWPPEAHTGNERLRWQLVLARVCLRIAEGRLSEAASLVDRIERESSPDLDASARASAAAQSARIAWARGDAAHAAASAQAAMTPLLERDEPDLYLATWVLRLRALHADQVGIASAAKEAGALRAWVDAHPTEWRRLEAMLAEAEQAWAEHRREAALARYADAAAAAARLGVPEDRVDVTQSYASALIAAGDLDRASAAVGGIAAWAERDVRAAWIGAQLYRALGRTDAWRQSTERSLTLARERVLPIDATPVSLTKSDD